MKPLQWTKIPNRATKSTVWEEVVEEAYGGTKKEGLVDEEGLLELFEKEEIVPRTVAETKKEPEVKKLTTLIDPRRAQNIAIMLGGLRLGYPDICRAIVTMDDSVLSTERLHALKLWAPTSEECDLVRSYEGDVEELGNAERYIREVMNVPRLSHRLEHMLFRKRFEEEVEEVVPDMETVLLACDQVRTSKRLRELLKQVLILGNYLNGTSFRGNAYGFKLEALLNLKDTRANRGTNNNKSLPTLLHYLVARLDQSQPELVDFLREMPRAELAARICIPALLASVKDLRRGVDGVTAELAEMRKLDHVAPDDAFVSTMEAFVSRASVRIAGLEYQAAVADRNVTDLVTFFGDDPADRADAPEEFFALFAGFSTALMQARADNETAQKVARQKEIYAQRVREAKAKKIKDSEESSSPPDDGANASVLPSPMTSQPTSYTDLRETLLRSLDHAEDPTSASASTGFARSLAPHPTFLAAIGASQEDILRLKPVDGELPFYQRRTVHRPKVSFESNYEDAESGYEDGERTTAEEYGQIFADAHSYPSEDRAVPRSDTLGSLASLDPSSSEDVYPDVNASRQAVMRHSSADLVYLPLPDDGEDQGLDATSRLMKTGSLLRARVTLKKKTMEAAASRRGTASEGALSPDRDAPSFSFEVDPPVSSTAQYEIPESSRLQSPSIVQINILPPSPMKADRIDEANKTLEDVTVYEEAVTSHYPDEEHHDAMESSEPELADESVIDDHQFQAEGSNAYEHSTASFDERFDDASPSLILPDDVSGFRSPQFHPDTADHPDTETAP
ncbi:hypothetical protein HKX48_005760 [Thoreauomyces humboldtii]|nr:hypothetical protein HKX48_005760 [Thoreauomyces humboldtii]